VPIPRCRPAHAEPLKGRVHTVMSLRRPARRTARTLRAAVLGVAVLGATAGLVAPSAEAAARTPYKPSGIRVAASSASSFTVTAARSRYAKQYRVFTSTTKGSLALVKIARTRRSAASVSPRITIGGLAYTSAPHYFRVQAINGGKVRYSDVYVAYLRPDAPTGLRVTARAGNGLALSWGGRPAGRYVITQATNPTLTAGVRRYTVTSLARTFTPYDLRRGTRYWFQVRAYGGSVTSGASAVVSAVAPSSGLSVRAMTYNLLHKTRDGERAGSGRIAPWSQRRNGIVALIKKANPDVVGLQEANDWVGPVKGPRIVDDLRNRLGAGRYTLAHTEVTPGQRGWFRTGRYILYRTSAFRAVAAGGHWTIGKDRYAAYQLLQSRRTGARFLAVSVHLEPGSGRTADLRRKAQTEKLLSLVRSYRATHPAPAIYMGDFNSHQKNVIDGPGLAFRAAGHVDADEVAQVRVNRKYNSANQYHRVPVTGGYDVDHVYVPAGVAVRRWEIVLNLSRGRFVGAIPSDHNPVAADLVLPY
jgi:endonuclease/exonuclease/phosphatase family metal-dependent hydrolase